MIAVGLSGVIGDSGHRKKRQEPERPDLVADVCGCRDRKTLAEIHNRPCARLGVGGGHTSDETG